MDVQRRQIFIVHPDYSLRNEIVELLRRHEYEAFAFDKSDIKVSFEDSIVFVHSDYQQDDIVHRLKSSGSAVVALGNDSVPSGFDAAVTGTESILEYLENQGARGHRRYVRFGSQDASIATFEFHHQDKRYAGVIHDISTAGMSCTFRPEPDSVKLDFVSQIQLIFPNGRSVSDGQLISVRVVNGQKIHVILFKGEMAGKEKLHSFIHSSLEKSVFG